jgi:flagellar FliL protein
MSTAAADASAPKKGKKKLIVVLAAVVLLAVLGAGAMLALKKKGHADDEGDGEEPVAHAKAASPKHDPKALPTFVPLDPFTVNLADREAERYAQVGITLEVGDPHIGDQIKAYMPAIRNNILMALGEKTAAQLMDREGKSKLAEQVRRETARAMGYDVDDDEDDEKADGDKPKRKKKRRAEALPVTAVHFSNFIIQ